jgi:riboflavin synthase
MFTGLVEACGVVRQLVRQPPGMVLVIDPAPLDPQISVGASVALNGCCLTAVEVDARGWRFAAGPETLSRTNLGLLQVGSRVNLERSLQLGSPLGGHFVTGHIDALAELIERRDEGDWSTIWCAVPPQLAPQLASKGSVAIDGVSLTVVDVLADRFSVQLIPHTLAVTTLGDRRAGDRVNLETDILAKYVAAQLAHRLPPQDAL